MGFFNTTKYTAKNITALYSAQLDNEMTFSFYIVDVIAGLELSQLEYSVLKQTGRDTTIVRDFAIVGAGVHNIYSIDETFLSSEVTISDKLTFRFKIADVNGNEHFIDIKDITVIN